MRVVVWSTGGVGAIAIDAISRRPDLELVGVWVHSPDKVGKDAGELAGIEPLGVAATNDADALIALAPDCVVYAANGRSAQRNLDALAPQKSQPTALPFPVRKPFTPSKS